MRSFCQPCQSMSSVMFKLHPLRVTKFLFYVSSLFFKFFRRIFFLARTNTSKPRRIFQSLIEVIQKFKNKFLLSFYILHIANKYHWNIEHYNDKCFHRLIIFSVGWSGSPFLPLFVGRTWISCALCLWL